RPDLELDVEGQVGARRVFDVLDLTLRDRLELLALERLPVRFPDYPFHRLLFDRGAELTLDNGGRNLPLAEAGEADTLGELARHFLALPLHTFAGNGNRQPSRPAPRLGDGNLELGCIGCHSARNRVQEGCERGDANPHGTGAPDPKSGASTSSATFAVLGRKI